MLKHYSEVRSSTWVLLHQAPLSTTKHFQVATKHLQVPPSTFKYHQASLMRSSQGTRSLSALRLRPVEECACPCNQSSRSTQVYSRPLRSRPIKETSYDVCFDDATLRLQLLCVYRSLGPILGYIGREKCAPFQSARPTWHRFPNVTLEETLHY